MKSGQGRPLHLELLERRDVPATFGVPWSSPLTITASFAPGGTPIGGTSDLSAPLFSEGLSTASRLEILRAAQSWVSVANLNIGVVDDSGAGFGSSGNVQGDERFGDIRIGSVAMSGALLASTAPPDPLAGTWAGDILANRRARLGVGESAGPYDTFTVFLQELGHALGLQNSPSTDSVMFDTYRATRLGLSQSDVEAIQGLYGSRRADEFDRRGSNDSIWSASRIGLSPEPKLGDITTPSDVDFYRFTSARGGWVEVNLATDGVSLLTAKLGLYSASRQLLVARTAIDPLSGNLTLGFRAEAGKTYYVRVGANPDSEFKVGAYHLSVAPEVVDKGTDSIPANRERSSGKPCPNVEYRPESSAATTGSDSRIVHSELNKLVSRTTLTEMTPTRIGSLSITEDQLVAFQISSDNTDANVGVRMLLYDQSGRLVRTASAFGNTTETMPVWLPSGSYSVAFQGIDRDGRSAGESTFEAKFETLSDSINPLATDPNYYSPPPPSPSPPPPSSPPSSTLPNPSRVKPQSYSWYYVDLTPLPSPSKPT